ncbi:hypothetical protein BJ742DRAFT_743549 [Cladochytrium replicatum]|nr:hypothetical protein BJ742DRAFT_743549 [Cladochytrium replicatum]
MREPTTSASPVPTVSGLKKSASGTFEDGGSSLKESQPNQLKSFLPRTVIPLPKTDGISRSRKASANSSELIPVSRTRQLSTTNSNEYIVANSERLARNDGSSRSNPVSFSHDSLLTNAGDRTGSIGSAKIDLGRQYPLAHSHEQLSTTNAEKSSAPTLIDPKPTADGQTHEAHPRKQNPAPLKVTTIEASTLLSLLQQRIMAKHNAPPVLVVDLRDGASDRARISGSVCVQLPAIIQKRIRKGLASKIPVDSFLADLESKNRYHEWVHDLKVHKTVQSLRQTSISKRSAQANSASNDGYVIIYDDTGGTQEPLARNYANGLIEDVGEITKLRGPPGGSDDALSSGGHSHHNHLDERGALAELLWSLPNSIVGFLDCGFKGFQQLGGADHYITVSSGNGGGGETLRVAPRLNPSIDPSHLRSTVLTSFSEVDARESPGSSAGGASGVPRVATPQPRKAGFSINTAAATQIPDRLKRNRTVGAPIRDLVTPSRSHFGELRSRPVEGRLGDTATHHDEQKHTDSDSPTGSPVNVPPVSLIVDPFLYLGSEEVPLADDAVEQLKALGITHVVNMAVEKCVQFMLEDRADQDVDHAVKNAISFIAKARGESSQNKLLVHCRAGKSRSATVVIGFLIVHGRMTLNGATNYVRQRRANISPNIGFWIKNYGNLISCFDPQFQPNPSKAHLQATNKTVVVCPVSSYNTKLSQTTGYR